MGRHRVTPSLLRFTWATLTAIGKSGFDKTEVERSGGNVDRILQETDDEHSSQTVGMEREKWNQEIVIND